MKPIRIKLIQGLTAVAALVALTAGAHAQSNLCTSAPGATSLSIDQAAAKAEALGYAVKQVKRSKGCWEIEGYDRNGAEIEIYLDPSSGEPVKTRGWRAPAQR